MHHFWDIRLVTIHWLWNQGYGSLKVIGTDTDRFATYDFLLTFHCNYGPISYRFWDMRRFQSKIAKFSHPPLLFCVPSKSPWNWVPALGSKKLEWWGYRADKEVWRYLQPSGTNARTWQTTDGHRATAKTALTDSVASHGKSWLQTNPGLAEIADPSLFLAAAPPQSLTFLVDKVPNGTSQQIKERSRPVLPWQRKVGS